MSTILSCMIWIILEIIIKIDCDEYAPNKLLISGTCSRPNIPPNARIRFVSSEKVKFAENETIYILCEENSFPHHVQKRKCRKGQWLGPPARCGKGLVTKVTKFEAFECSRLDTPIMSVNLSQTDEPPHPLPPNSFHFSRIPENLTLTVYGHDCYKWFIEFEQPIEMQFLLVDINVQKTDSIKHRPEMEINIKNRKCKLVHTVNQVIDSDEIFGNYFFCDLFENVTLESEFKTDWIEMTIKTFHNRSVGLEAVFVGETFKKKHSGNKMATDCGKLEIQRTGVLEQVELSHAFISCNDSFVSASPVKKHKFTCDHNGLWQGEWPVCLPKQTCAKEEVMENLDDSIQLEQIGNVYYVNDTEWLAKDHTWVHYACTDFEGIMVGKSERTCKGGKWTNKKPHCTTALQSGSQTITIIIVILIILIGVFSLIVYLSIRSHSKKIHRKLESTKSELEERALNKQISNEYYTDIGLETIYEDCKEIYNIPEYETADDVRYETGLPRMPINEPEYLSMTEGTAKRNREKNQQQITQQSLDLYEYSI